MISTKALVLTSASRMLYDEQLADQSTNQPTSRRTQLCISILKCTVCWTSFKLIWAETENYMLSYRFNAQSAAHNTVIIPRKCLEKIHWSIFLSSIIEHPFSLSLSFKFLLYICICTQDYYIPRLPLFEYIIVCIALLFVFEWFYDGINSVSQLDQFQLVNQIK